MGTTREGSTGDGAHEYTCGPFTITQMGNDLWQIFERHTDGVLYDLGDDYFATLAKARAWCRSALVARIDASLAAEGRPAIRDYPERDLRLWLKEKLGKAFPKIKDMDALRSKVWIVYEATRMVA